MYFIDKSTELFVVLWTSLIWFIATNVEPHVGIWVCSSGGAIMSAFNTDKKLGRFLLHVIIGTLFGIFFSKILVNVFISMIDSRVAFAFAIAYFSERLGTKIDNMIGSASISDILKAIKPGGKS